jgi:pimeloyl-[acyl-carrier protein] methyl ester esterase
MSMAITYHGWGFDSTCWQPWAALLAQQGEEILVSDRGYFNAPMTPPTKPQSIIFAHSYGLHLCPIERLQSADVLVLFGSFLCFHPLSESKGRRSRLVLAQMIRQFQINPQAVLEAFRVNCYSPVLWDSSDAAQSLDTDLLLEDLNGLDRCLLDVFILKKIPKILILQGVQDQIVPVEKGRELAAALPDNSQYMEVEQAGHGLPFTHVEICWSWIESRLGAV